MSDIATAMWSGIRESEALGKLMRGLAVLARTQTELWMIVEGREPRRFAVSSLGFSLEGMSIDGEMAIPFATVSAYEGRDGEPCICFETDGAAAIIAPAAPPGTDEFMKDAVAMLRSDWYDLDTVYLSDLNGSLGRHKTPEGESEVQLRRPTAVAQAAPDMDAPHPDDEMVILGEVMRLGDLTWMERDTDGDGNRYGHIVLSDGRYRRVTFGDLSR